MSSCLFCEIAEGNITSAKILENDNFLAFRDIDPKAPVHFLVIPKKHFENITDFANKDSEMIAKYFEFISEVSNLQELEKGHRVVFNTGADGGQTVFHVHAHVLGGRNLQWPPG